MLRRIEQDPGFRAEFEEKPTDNVVVTGFAQRTPLGGTQETWQRILNGESGVQEYNFNNFRTNIAAPIDFDPDEYFNKIEQQNWAPVTTMGVLLAQEAGLMAEVLNPQTKKRLPYLKKYRVGTCVSTGVGAIDRSIDIYNTIHAKDSEGREDPRRGSRKISPREILKFLPEEINGQIAIAIECSGWGVNTIEACATGLSNPVEAYELIRRGKLDIAFAGALDLPFANHPEVAIGPFAVTRGALSTRNDEPKRASRPFDKDRDGFVMGSGGAVLVLEREDHARERGAHIYAYVLGAEKSMDGNDSMVLDSENVALTITRTLYDRKTGAIHMPDAIFAHATSTVAGDIKEAEVFKLVFGDQVSGIAITAIKSNLGHLAGGAGAVNAVVAIQALNENKIPHILNLDNADPEILEMGDFYFVRGKPLEKPLNEVLVTAYGFGGYNAVMLLGKNF